MIRVDAWQPPGGSFQDISVTSNYRGLFLSSTSLAEAASPQWEPSAETIGFLRGVLATTGEFPVAFYKLPGFSAQTFHTNMRAWFSAYATAREPGYLRVLWEDGSTQLRIPARVVSRATIPGVLDAYQVILKADQPHFEATSETTSTTNSGNVRCGVEVEFPGANLSNSAHGTDFGPASNRLVHIDCNFTTPGSSSRVLVNGVPTPWRTGASQHVWAIVNGEGTINIEVLHGLSGSDPLQNAFTANQLTLGNSSGYFYSDMQISTLLGDDDLGGLWKPKVYLPSSWPQPSDGIGYYAEDTSDGFRLHLNDTPSFGGTGAFPYNAVYLDSGGEDISSVTSWDVTLAGFTGSEALAVLLSRQRGAGDWEVAWSSSTNGAAVVSVSPSGYCTELMWTIVPIATTFTTDPSLEINPDGATALTIGSNPNLSTDSTRYKRLHGTWQNNTTGQGIVFQDFVTRGQVDIHTPSRRVDWDVEMVAGDVYGSFYFTDPLRGIELAAGSNSISHGAGGSTPTVKHRGGYG